MSYMAICNAAIQQDACLRQDAPLHLSNETGTQHPSGTWMCTHAGRYCVQLVHNMLDSVALPPDAQSASPPKKLKTHAKVFQLQGLHWMLERERKGDALGRYAQGASSFAVYQPHLMEMVEQVFISWYSALVRCRSCLLT